MILPLIAGLALALASDGATGASPLEPKAACGLASKIPEGTYAVRGVYLADGMHGSILELPGCDRILRPDMEGAALARISAYHSAYARKCGGVLLGDHIAGVFVGHFERRKGRNILTGDPEMRVFFVITDVETTDEDSASITCAK